MAYVPVKWRTETGKASTARITSFSPSFGNWDSFYLEFLPVVKGEGRRDLDFADWFKKHPAKPALIKALEKPLQIPWEHTSSTV